MKVHYQKGQTFKAACGTTYPKMGTEDWDEVTCKRCLKQRERIDAHQAALERLDAKHKTEQE